MEPREALKRADDLLKRGQAEEAADVYKRVALFYASQGFSLKAIALWKQIRQVAGHVPALDAEARKQLIPLYRSLGLEQDARTLEAER